MAKIKQDYKELLEEKGELLATYKESQAKLEKELEETKTSAFEEMENSAGELMNFKEQIESLTKDCDEVCS